METAEKRSEEVVGVYRVTLSGNKSGKTVTVAAENPKDAEEKVKGSPRYKNFDVLSVVRV